MKSKFFLSMWLVISLPAVAISQKIGVNIGLGVGQLNKVGTGLSSIPDYKYSLSYAFDINTRIKLSEKWSISPGIGLSSISTNYRGDLYVVGQDSYNVKLSLMYLTAPIRFNFLIKKTAFHIGPSIGYQLSKELKSEENIYIRPHWWNRKFDYGIDIGIGYKFSEQITSGIIFYNGFGNVEKVKCGNCEEDLKETSKVQSFRINLTYIFSK
jgi:hypothetical protein